jgi:hypothetical protein
LAGNTVALMSFVVDLIALIFGMPRALFPQIAHESLGGPIERGSAMALLAAAISAGAVVGGVFSGCCPGFSAPLDQSFTAGCDDLLDELVYRASAAAMATASAFQVAVDPSMSVSRNVTARIADERFCAAGTSSVVS